MVSRMPKIEAFCHFYKRWGVAAPQLQAFQTLGILGISYF
jgi:hypothetical protein